jgi:dsDNA-binding SOS-regulon protein
MKAFESKKIADQYAEMLGHQTGMHTYAHESELQLVDDSVL